MPYENEFASYRPLGRIAESEEVKSLLKQARVSRMTDEGPSIDPVHVAESAITMPEFVVAIDGSYAEVDVKNGYPGAKVGYCTVASVLLMLAELNRLDQHRPVDPIEFRKTEESSTIDAALPGSNVVIGEHISARDSFRQRLYDSLHDKILDEDNPIAFIRTYEELLALKPNMRDPLCPYDYDGCELHFSIGAGMSGCPCEKRRAIYSTDALRIHERFHADGTNGEALGEVMQVWERVLLIHILRCFERRDWLDMLPRIAFVMDGPLALFGHPAWLSAAISKELKRINAAVRDSCGEDILLFGVEKTGTFVDHYAEIDQTESPGVQLFGPRTGFLLSDAYIKRRVIYSTSDKRYGLDTYFGRKMFYKTRNGARIVVNIPFLNEEQDSLEDSDLSLYPQISTTCLVLDKLVSSRFPNSLSPVIAAHANAAIPFNLGAKVLQQLAKALMRDE